MNRKSLALIINPYECNNKLLPIHNLKEQATIHNDDQCCFLGTLSAIAYYESPVFEVGLFLPQS